MPVVESYDTRAAADLAATDYFYISATGGRLRAFDLPYDFSAGEVGRHYRASMFR